MIVVVKNSIARKLGFGGPILILIIASIFVIYRLYNSDHSRKLISSGAKSFPVNLVAGTCSVMNTAISVKQKHVVFVHSWQCLYCREESRKLERLMANGANGMPIQWVDIGPKPAAPPKRSEEQCSAQEALLVDLGLRSVPALIFLDGRGKVRSVREGNSSEKELVRLLSKSEAGGA
ncbi:MAG: thioredoxin family protein [Acidobacteria bacterium]|nr:thioredoxin family protein [Acidobacteriota bacterium]